MVGGTNGNYDDRGIKITDNQDGSTTINGTLTSNTTITKISKEMNITLKSGQPYTLFVEAISGSVDSNFSKLIFQDNTQIAGVSGNTSTAYTFTPNQDYTGKINFGIYAGNGKIFTNYKFRVMLVKGSYTYSQLTWENYITPITKQLSLGGRKVYEGDYLWVDTSTGKKYHHHKMADAIFTGASSENITLQNTVENIIGMRLPTELVKHNTQALANYCRYVPFSDGYYSHRSYGKIAVHPVDDYSNVYVSAPDSTITTVELYKSWLTTHNVEVVYQLATETDEEITGTLADQMQEIWGLMSIKGTTIIESNGNLPMIIKARSLKGV